MAKDRFESSAGNPSEDDEVNEAVSILQGMGYNYIGRDKNLFYLENDNTEDRYKNVTICSYKEHDTPIYDREGFVVYSSGPDDEDFGEIPLSQFIKQKSFCFMYKKHPELRPDAK